MSKSRVRLKATNSGFKRAQLINSRKYENLQILKRGCKILSCGKFFTKNTSLGNFPSEITGTNEERGTSDICLVSLPHVLPGAADRV